MSFAQLDKERTKKQKAKAEKEGKPVEKGPDLEELARDVLVGKCVAAIEDKGMLTSPMLNLVSRALFDKMNYEGRIAERRKIGNTLGLAEARRHETAFPKLTPGKLAGLIFEQAFDDIFEVGTVLELDTLAADVCELLHVDPEKVHAEVKAGIEAKKAAAAAKPAAKPVGNKPAKKAAKAGKKAA